MDIKLISIASLDIFREGRYSPIFRVVVCGATCVMELVNRLELHLLILLVLSVA